MILWSTIYQALHYGCALTTTLSAITSFLFRLGQVKKRKEDLLRHRRICSTCIGLLTLSYAGEGIITGIQDDAFVRFEAQLTHLVALTLVWGLIGLRSTRVSSTEVWAASLVTSVFEVPLLILSPFPKLDHLPSTLRFICQIARVLLLFLLLAYTSRTWRSSRLSDEPEAQPFLHEESRVQTYGGSSYGTKTPSVKSNCDNESAEESNGEGSDSDSEARMKRVRAKRLKEAGSWWAYLKDFSIFLPYLIPKNDVRIQLCYLVSILCIAGTRTLNVLEPIQLGKVADGLLSGEMPFQPLAIWLLLSLLNANSGIGFIEELAKIPIKQFSQRKVTNAAFAHVLSLGMDFHSERDSAEIMTSISQGRALTNVLETLVLEIAPTVIDLFIAILLLYSKFNAYVALAMLVACITYVTLDVKVSSLNQGNRRDNAKAEREEAKIMHMAVQGWQTVSYFNMFSFERIRFGKAVETHLLAERRWDRGYAYAEAIRELLVPTTFSCLSCLIFLQISRGEASPGDFVFLIQYWDILVWPLKFLSSHHRWLMADLIDAERLLDLLQTKPTIVDKEDARDLGLVTGHVAFEDVCFSYDSRKPVIKDVNFTASPGDTIALVGETGAGKSSIMKLLLRFYDITSGAIKVDGISIGDVTTSSLRDALGIVPQDPLLFNASIMENLRYAKPSATIAEITAACQAAAIHDKILTFPDGYDTTVGEHGVKLSGGEVQRLAIARVFLKDPPILILDEATSAVDTATETEIQKVLVNLTRRRTTFVIAHRLSTIVGADRILVMHDGQVVESGSHRELLSLRGRYHGLWKKQIEGVAMGEPPTVEKVVEDGKSARRRLSWSG